MLKIKVFNYQTGGFQEISLAPENKPTQECLIGRTADCDVILESPDVSRSHAKIQGQKGAYAFTDLGSANGSSLNSQDVKANQSYSLKVSDLLRIADFVLFIEAIEVLTSSSETSVLIKQTGGNEWVQGDLTVRCVRITDETADVKTFTFMADLPVRFSHKPGQFVTLDLDINGESVLRSYSISSSPSRSQTLEITVKRVLPSPDMPQAPAGLVSNWLHDHLKVGDAIKLSEPLGKFTCAPTPPAKLLLISAGSGITPMMSMSRWIADLVIPTDIIFYHCARSPQDIIFRQELEMMSARLPNFNLVISTTRSPLGQPWYGLTGRLTASVLQSIAPDFQERTVYVCGPNGFMQATKDLMAGLNFPMQNYYEESFGAPKKPVVVKAAIPEAIPVASNGHSSQPLVVFAKSNKEILGDGSESILELAEQEGVKIRSNCRQGVCGACKKRKLEGEVKYDSEPDALEPEDQAAGYVLTCVACPVGRVVIEA
ncbi:MAG: FHA domain-containing protein [Timaviella obliquedivisa GSE-PSE-MK23-08B]|jgi:ferredoxin-NADP reductase|nr:FHA domain-containing protein [Timaviella obliquedivisa GSE-PSE-MK23-08B]